jgi:hypothetical protein
MADKVNSTLLPKFSYDSRRIERQLTIFSERVGEARGLHVALSVGEHEAIIATARANEIACVSQVAGPAVIGSQRDEGGVATLGQADVVAAMMNEANDPERVIDVATIAKWKGMLSGKMTAANAEPDTVVYSEGLPVDITGFLDCIGDSGEMPEVCRAAVALLWCEVFGRSDGQFAVIGRVVIAHFFARSGGLPFSVSREIARDQGGYATAVATLRQRGRGAIDATEFVVWLLGALLCGADICLENARWLARRNRFFMRCDGVVSRRQELALRRLFAVGPEAVDEGFSARSYRQIADVSSATATRDLAQMCAKRVLRQGENGGRSTRYSLEF